MIGFEIPAQLIAFMNKLFQLGIHPRDISFADHLNGDGLCLNIFRRLQNFSKPLYRDPTDDNT